MEIIATKLKRKFTPIWQLIIGINAISLSILFAFTFIFMLTETVLSAWTDLTKAILIFGGFTAIFILIGVHMISRFVTWRDLPETIAEFDGHYLYIHGKNEIKIYVLDLKDARVYDGNKHLRYDVFIYRKGKKRLVLPFTENPFKTVNKLNEIIKSIKV